MTLTAVVLLPLFAFQTDYQAIGLKAMDAGKFEEAEKAFEKAVTAAPNDYGALFNLSLAQTFVEKDDLAIVGFRKVLEMKPGLAEAQVNLGLLLYRHRDFAGAIDQFKPALEKKPKDIRTLYHLADSLRETNQCPGAEQYYRRVLELDASQVASKLGLARCVAAAGRLDEAAPLFEQSGGLLELAQLYEDKGQTDKVIPIYEAAVKQEPSLPLLSRLAAAYLKTKQPDKAQPIVEQALKQSPDDFDLHLVYGRLLRDKRNFPGAAQEFIRALRIKPDNIDALNELAGMLISLNEDAKAIAVLDRLRALNAETPGQMFFRAVVLDRNHQTKPALAAYQAFLAASKGQFPEEEFKARQRAKILEREASKK